MSNTSQSKSEALEISLIRPTGRGEVFLRSSFEHPGMLIVIGFGGLPHGAVIGLDAENRACLRQWLDAQEPTHQTRSGQTTRHSTEGVK